MFVVPVRIEMSKADSIRRSIVNTETIAFVDSVRNTGVISGEKYLEFQNKIKTKGEVYKVDIQVLRKGDGGITENSQIINCFQNNKNKKLKIGDFIKVEVYDSSGIVTYYGGSIRDEAY